MTIYSLDVLLSNFEPDIVPCLVLTVASWPAFRFQEAGTVVWYSHLLKNFPQFVVIHTVKVFSIVNEADVFLEFSCFFYDPTDVDNLVSGSSANFRHDKIFQPPFCHWHLRVRSLLHRTAVEIKVYKLFLKLKIILWMLQKHFLSDYSTEEILIAHYLSKNKYRLILSYTKYFYFGPSILMCP